MLTWPLLIRITKHWADSYSSGLRSLWSKSARWKKREAAWFLIYSNLQTRACVKRLHAPSVGSPRWKRFLTSCAHTLLKCALHSCRWLYNSWCASVKSVHCPVCAQSMKSPVTCNNLLPELFVVLLLEMHFRVTDQLHWRAPGIERPHDLMKRWVMKLLWTILAFAIVIARIKMNS